MSNIYTAALIHNGQTMSVQTFEAIDDQAAYIEGTGDIDPLIDFGDINPMKGYWVDIRRVNTDAPTDLQAVIDNASK